MNLFERPCVQLKPGLRAATLARHRDIPELEDNNSDRHTVGVGVGVVHGAPTSVYGLVRCLAGGNRSHTALLGSRRWNTVP